MPEPLYDGLTYTTQTERYFVESPQAFKQDLLKPAWIPFLPTPGKFKHPLYGEIDIKPETNQAMVDSVKNHVYQQHIPIDAEHETKLSGAVGWLTDMRVNGDGSADALVEFTDRGRKLLSGGQFKYVSPEWFDAWTDPATEIVHKNVIAGGAITTRPFFKDKALRALVANENGSADIVAKESGMKQCADCKKMYAESAKACPSCQSTKVMNDKETTVPDPKTYAEGSPELQKILDDAKAAAAAEAKTAAEADVQAKIDAAVADAKKATEVKPEPSKEFAELNVRLTAAEARATAAETVNTTLTTSLTEIRNAERRRRFSDVVAGTGGANDGGAWVGDSEKNVGFLEFLADQVGETHEKFIAYVEQQNAAAAQARETNLFSQNGTSAASKGGNDPEAKLESLTRAKMTAETIPHARAYNEILGTPEGAALYDQVERSRPR